EGGALVLVDHDLWLVQAVCSRCAVLDEGKLVYVGSAPDAIGYYVESQMPSAPDPSAPVEVPESGLAIEAIRVSHPSGGDLVSDGAADVELTCRATRELGRVRWGFVVVTGDQMITIATELMEPDEPAVHLGPGRHVLTARIARLPLMEGTYRIRALVVDDEREEPIALAGWEEAPTVIRVVGAASDIRTAAEREVRPTLMMDATWEVSPTVPERPSRRPAS
ncbi:MAG: hypothetical protein AAGK32_15320, partial [Actinomycetota bacterium]